jgi:hypothetical protein
VLGGGELVVATEKRPGREASYKKKVNTMDIQGTMGAPAPNREQGGGGVDHDLREAAGCRLEKDMAAPMARARRSREALGGGR